MLMRQVDCLANEKYLATRQQILEFYFMILQFIFN